MSIVTTTEVERASDQQLQQEVTQPTGALGPAYVVVGEILKRKQIRAGAPQKEIPRSTVKEDVARGLNAMPQAAMSAAGRDVMPQMPPQMPPQMMPPQMMPPPQMPPQQMPPQQGMADGGIVAFQAGGLLAQQLSAVEKRIADAKARNQTPSVDDMLQAQKLRSMVNAPTPVTVDPNASKEVSPTNIPNKNSFTLEDMETYAGAGADKIDPNLFPKGAFKGEPSPYQKKETDLFANNQKKIAMPGSMLPNLGNLKKATDELINFSSISDEKLSALRSEAGTKYEDERQDIFKIFQSSIEDARKEKTDIKKNNFNDALINAGAAILEAPGGRNLKWLGKGLSVLQKKFEEGRSMLRSANKDLRRSEMSFEQAKELQRQGKESAADRAEKRALSQESRGKEKLKDKVAGYATVVEAQNSIFKLQTDRESAKSQLAYLKYTSGATSTALKAAERATELTKLFKQEFNTMSDLERQNTGFTNARDYAENKLIVEQNKYNYMQNTGPLNSGISGVSQTIPFTSALGDQMRNQLLPKSLGNAK